QSKHRLMQKLCGVLDGCGAIQASIGKANGHAAIIDSSALVQFVKISGQHGLHRFSRVSICAMRRLQTAKRERCGRNTRSRGRYFALEIRNSYPTVTIDG